MKYLKFSTSIFQYLKNQYFNNLLPQYLTFTLKNSNTNEHLMTDRCRHRQTLEFYKRAKTIQVYEAKTIMKHNSILIFLNTLYVSEFKIQFVNISSCYEPIYHPRIDILNRKTLCNNSNHDLYSLLSQPKINIGIHHCLYYAKLLLCPLLIWLPFGLQYTQLFVFICLGWVLVQYTYVHTIMTK